MENKIIEKWEIAVYRQEINNKNFKWQDVEAGYTVSDAFANHDYEIVESFDNEAEARKEFNNEYYEMSISNIVRYNCSCLRYIEEYELQQNRYEINKDGEIELLEVVDGEFSKIGNNILSEKDFEELKKYNFKYDTLEEFDNKLKEYNFYIDGKNDIYEVYKNNKCDDQDENCLVSYKYKDTNIYLHCSIDLEFDENGEKVIDSIYSVNFDFC